MSIHADIQALYLTVYNRPADWNGLLYWAGQLESRGFEAMSGAFTQALEFEEMYGGLSTTEQVRKIYQHLLDREADEGGLTYWAARIDAGEPLATVARLIGAAAEGADSGVFANRIETSLEQTYGEFIDVLYAGYYGRGADPQGRSFWITTLKASDGDLSTVIKAFGNSQEYVLQYSSLDSEQSVTKLYQNLFNRHPEEEGMRYWAEKLSSGELALSQIAFTIAEGARGTDRNTLEETVTQFNPSFLLTLQEALTLDVLPPRFNLDTTKPVDGGILTVAEAETLLAKVTESISRAENSAALGLEALFDWEILDSAAAVLAAIEASTPAHVTGAGEVRVIDVSVPQIDFEILLTLRNFAQGDLIPEKDAEPFGWKLLASLSSSDENSWETTIVPFISDGTASGSFTIEDLSLIYRPVSVYDVTNSSGGWIVNEKGFATFLNVNGFSYSSGGVDSKFDVYAGGGWITDGTAGGTQKISIDTLKYGAGSYTTLNEYVVVIGERGFYATSDYLDENVYPISTPANYFPDYGFGKGILINKDIGVIWYTGYTPPYGRELYSLTANEFGVEAQRLTDIRPGEANGVGSLDGAVLRNDGSLLFFGWSGQSTAYPPNEIWQSDGTKEGTSRSFGAENYPSYPSYNGFISMFNVGTAGDEVVVAERGRFSEGLYSLDFENGKLVPIVENLDQWSFEHLGSLDGAIYFSGIREGTKYIYRYEGGLVAEELGIASEKSSVIAWGKEFAYLYDEDDLHGREIWMLDFSNKNYQIHQDLLPGSGSSSPSTLYGKSILVGDSLITSAYLDEMGISTVITHRSGDYEVLFESGTRGFKEISGGIVVFSESNEVWFVESAEDESVMATKILSSNIDYGFNNDLISFGDNSVFYRELGEINRLVMFSLDSKDSTTIFQGDIHQFKVFSDDVVFISDTTGGLYFYGETDGELTTRFIDQYDGIVELVGSSILTSENLLLG